MGVTSGRVEIAVKITDVGQSKAVKALNKDLDASAKASKGAAASTVQWGKGLLGGAEQADKLKSKFAMITGIIPGIAGGIAAIGATVGLVAAAFEALTGPSRIDRLNESVRAIGGAADSARDRITGLGAEIDGLAAKARDARIDLAKLQGNDDLASRLTRQKELDAAAADGTARRLALLKVEGELFTANMLQRNWAENALFELQQEHDRLIQSGRLESAKAMEGDILHAESVLAQVERNVSALEADRAKLQRDIANSADRTLTLTRQQQGAQAEIARIQAAGLKAQDSAISGMLGLFAQVGASSKRIEALNKAQFEVRRQIALIDLASTEATLRAEGKRLELAHQQVLIASKLLGMSDEQAKRLADAAAAYKSVGGALDAVQTQRNFVETAVYRPPPKGGGAGPAPQTPAGRFSLGGGATTPSPYREHEALALVLDPSVGATLARYVQGETEIVRQLNELEANQTRERARILGEYDAAVVNATAARSDAQKALGEIAGAAPGAVGGEVGALLAAQYQQQGAVSGATKAITDAERAKQAALTELASEGARARADIARSEASEQMAAYGQIGAGMQAAFAEIRGVGSATQDFFQATIGLAKGVADHWADIEAGKSGVIAAITAEAAAGIKSKKAQYALQAAGYAAEAVVAFARYDTVAGALYLIGAGMFAAAAGSSGGSKGRAPARAPSVRSTDLGQGGAVIINLNAPLLSNQESAAWMLNTMRSAAGTGFGAG